MTSPIFTSVTYIAILYWLGSNNHAIKFYWHQHLWKVNRRIACRSIHKSNISESHVGVHTKSQPVILESIRLNFFPLTLMRQHTAVCLLLQEEITFSRCSSSTVSYHQGLPFDYSELHTFCSFIIDPVSLWTVKNLGIMDLQVCCFTIH